MNWKSKQGTTVLLLVVLLSTTICAFLQGSDPFKALGLPRTRSLTKKDVLKAYRQQSLRYHPDKNSSPDAIANFHQLTESRDHILSLISHNGFQRSSSIRQFSSDLVWLVKPVGVAVIISVALVVLIPKLTAGSLLKALAMSMKRKLFAASIPL